MANNRNNLKIKEQESKEYRWSEELQLYIKLEPLKISDEVIKVAAEIGIEKLRWNEEGLINEINLIDAQKLTEKLGGQMLTVRQFWAAYMEAIRNNDKELVASFESENTEWLNTVYLKDKDEKVWMIENPRFVKHGEMLEVVGERREIVIPKERPGWFEPYGNIDIETGFPKIVSRLKNKGDSSTWKYWAVEQVGSYVGTVRSFVISSVTPAMDNDIPIAAPIISNTIRICRKTLPESPIDWKILKEVNKLIEEYDKTTVNQAGEKNPDEHFKFFKEYREKVLKFVKKNGKDIFKLRSKEAKQITEKMIDMLGVVRIIAQHNGDKLMVEKVKLVAKEVFRADKEFDKGKLIEFVKNRESLIIEALKNHTKIVVVMGHKNPDADTGVGSLLEAYRRQQLDPITIYLPLLQSLTVPNEIKFLLGEELSEKLMKENNKLYDEVKKSGLARWVLTDHNVSEVQRFVDSIVDHHFLSDKAKKMTVPLTWEMLGSSVAMIWLKIQGLGIEIKGDLNKIIYGATLLDTENRNSHKMTFRDQLIMEQIQLVSKVGDSTLFYQEMMGYMLTEKRARVLFDRDYKEDWFLMGFAVAKVKNVFDTKGKIIEKELLNDLVKMAYENNRIKNFAVTLVKVVNYEDNNTKVGRERIYSIFNKNALPEFKDFFIKYLERIIKFRFGKSKNFYIETKGNYIDFYGTGDQLSRKVTAPFLEKVVEVFNRFYKCETTGLWMSRKLVEDSVEIRKLANKLDINYGVDKGRVVNLNFLEARKLIKALGGELPSLGEWREMERQSIIDNDQQMKENCNQMDICETIDTVVFVEDDGKQYIVDHPEKIKMTDGIVEIQGKKIEVKILKAEPGLTLPEDFDKKTGLFTKVYPANMQGKLKGAVRVWSPRDPISRATITSINLNRTKAVDLRMGLEEAFMKLGIRLCLKKIQFPKLKIYENDKGVYFRETSKF